MMYLSHTYDHRVVDGTLGGKFCKRELYWEHLTR
ncbi:MAG: 2-oxo acid dehydrogenase subunit E2 [Bacteroidetes bacterium]|nr:2-oxo acid dehydrogenase subunit E2 [Bacteroidota bacterium]